MERRKLRGREGARDGVRNRGREVREGILTHRTRNSVRRRSASGGEHMRAFLQLATVWSDVRASIIAH